jgi:hypothetical protein
MSDVSLQVAILKVLVSYPEGRASLDDMKRDLDLLTSSGREWADRLKRLAARAPNLDVFGQKLVTRDANGWAISNSGRELLELIQNPSYHVPVTEVVAASEPAKVLTTDMPSELSPNVISLASRKSRGRRRGRRDAALTVAG